MENAKKNVYLPLRIIKDTQNRTIGWSGWNCFFCREELAMMGLPAGAFVNFENLKHEDELFTDEDVLQYINNNDPNPKNNSSLAPLFYFSNEELCHWNLRDQLSGFYFVSCKGLQNVDSKKWNTGGKESLKGMTTEQLMQEMDACSKRVQVFLQQECVKSHHANANYMYMDKPATYTLVKQVRYVPDSALPLFERVLNVSSYVTRRLEFIV
eukprot:gene22683-25695_t